MEGRRVVRKNKKESMMKKIRIAAVIVLLLAAGVFCYVKFKPETGSVPKTYHKTDQLVNDTNEGYAISTSCKEATEAGVRILENGGNAADAAIAVSYSLAVAEPYASGLGGGGCMLIYDPKTDDYYFYNYGSEAANSGFSSTILVPGMVSGMEAVRNDFGTMDLSALLADPIKYCDGFEITEVFATRIDRASGLLGENSIYFDNGKWLTTGDTLIQSELKNTLEILASEGADSFYTGTIASQISQELGMSMSDLAAYETICTKPISATYSSYDIVSAAAPYSGMTLIQMLKMMETLELPAPSADNQTFINGLQQATAAAHSDRIKHVYDYNYTGEAVDYNQYVNDSYIYELLNMVPTEYEEDESEDTTAFSIIDKDGMIVVCTNTLSSYFGAKCEVGGFYMNNSGVNFGTGVNGYAPGKRPRTHISPTILRSDDEIVAIATPGGNAIVKVLATVISDICMYGTSPEQAIEKQRLMFKTSDVIYYEIGYDTDNFANGTGAGYTTIPTSDHTLFGCIALSGYSTEDGYYAVADMRRDSFASQKNE